MNVLIVDSSSAIISRLTELLAEETTICTIYGTNTLKKIVEVINEKRPDVIIIDSTIRDNNSIEWIKEIIANEKRPEIIALA